jgi:predicted aconitase with swiveling domain
MSWQAEVLFAGVARGEVLRLEKPISFWGGVNPASAEIVLDGHPQQGLCIDGKILVVPQLIGSSSSSAVMLELIYQQKAPAALILGSRDAILPIGVLVARQMQWSDLPVLVMRDLPFTSGMMLSIDGDGRVKETAQRNSFSTPCK